MEYSEHQKTLQGYIKLLTGGFSNLLIIVSKAGYGKTTMVLEAMKSLPEGSYLYVNNYITPPEFYALLEATEKLQPPKILILDDIEYSLQNKQFQGLLKSATWEAGERKERVVNYLSNFYKTKDLPAIKFSGKIILLLNEIPKKQNILKAVLDRSLFYEIKMNNKEIIEAMGQIVKKPFETLSFKDRMKVWDFIRTHTTSKDNISFRTLILGFKCYLYSRYSWNNLLLNLIKQK